MPPRLYAACGRHCSGRPLWLDRSSRFRVCDGCVPIISIEYKFLANLRLRGMLERVGLLRVSHEGGNIVEMLVSSVHRGALQRRCVIDVCLSFSLGFLSVANTLFAMRAGVALVYGSLF